MGSIGVHAFDSELEDVVFVEDADREIDHRDPSVACEAGLDARDADAWARS